MFERSYLLTVEFIDFFGYTELICSCLIKVPEKGSVGYNDSYFGVLTITFECTYKCIYVLEYTNIRTYLLIYWYNLSQWVEYQVSVIYFVSIYNHQNVRVYVYYFVALLAAVLWKLLLYKAPQGCFHNSKTDSQTSIPSDKLTYLYTILQFCMGNTNKYTKLLAVFVISCQLFPLLPFFNEKSSDIVRNCRCSGCLAEEVL